MHRPTFLAFGRLRPRRARRGVAPAVLSLALLIVPAPAAAQWTFEGFVGGAFSVPTPLTISQAGYPDVRFTAHYETKPLASRLYYAWRLARWTTDHGWLLEHVHHKIYLKTPTSVVQDFEVSHGYNLVTINRGWKRGHNVLVVGGGLVITFPHSDVRGKIYPHKETYKLSGATIQGGVARQLDLSKHVFVTGEGKFSASWARVPIVDGHAKVPNVAFHFLAGGGWQF